MAKEIKKCEGGMCACGCSCHAVGAYHWHVLLRWFLGLIIVVLVFNLGVAIGELKSQMVSGWPEAWTGRGGRMMSGWDRADDAWTSWNVPMMRSGYTVPTASTTPGR
jgi:hypothetical protein